MSNLELFDETTFTEFEEATAEQLAISAGRKSPNEADMRQAVSLCQRWNRDRRCAGLLPWE